MEDGNQAVGYIPVSDANGTMTWTDPATVVGAEAWSKSGNAGTTSGTDFLGTTDNVDFRIRTNGIERITVENGTNTTATRVGIGTNTVSTQTAFQAGLEIAGNVPNLILNDQTGGEQDDFSIVNGGGVAELMNGTTSSTIMALGLAQYSNNVGVGTITPSDRLHVEGSIRMVDGNQAVGYIPVSDANGTMVWTDPATIATAADSDGDATNELQTLSISGNDITLSDGGGTVSFPIQTQLTDADDDTKIQVEETADEDIIRFDLAGTEYFTMVGPRLEIKNSGQSVFIGESAGLVDDLTNNNTFIGYESGMTNSTGYNNTAVGLFASRSTNARENTSLGAYALYSNQSGVRNTVIGTGAGQDIVGSRNTIVGSFAGNSATGSDNVFLGYLAGVNESGDHRLYIENSVSSAPLIYGEFDNDIVGINGSLGVGTQSPQDELHVEGAIRMVDGNQAAGYIPVSDVNGTMVWTDPTTITTADDGDWAVSGNDIYNANTGYVGVNTTTPSAELDVMGRIHATNPGSSPDGSNITLSSPGGDIGITLTRGDGSGNAQQRWDLKIENDNSLRFRSQNTDDHFTEHG